ncbi:unnamed protein product [Ilex paraguariensis]|uniref:Uncharacterized protein n=1 Tax=Ilex paraguariensis TaxID=185542 RepID=A0ABC8TU16_9AQUA
MGRSRFLAVLVLSTLLILSSSHGFGRELMETSGGGESATTALLEENAGGESREMTEVLDYVDPGPNTNPKSGLLPPPSPHR